LSEECVSGTIYSISHLSCGVGGRPQIHFFNTTFLLGHTGLYETEHPSPRKLNFLFLELEGWDQHRCNPLARLPLAHPAQALLLAPTGSCQACVGSQSTPTACTSGCTGCVALFFEEKLGPGVSPTVQEKWDWLYGILRVL
jgi:hypothetical protein